MSKIGIQEIARLANVSIGTVDRALHGRKDISEVTRRRILRIAKDLGYKPNLAARALSVGGPAIRIGVCLPRELHYFYDQVRSGRLAEARRVEQRGVDIVYRPVERLGSGEVERIKDLLADRVQVLTVCPGDPKALAPVINAAEEKNIRVICVATDAAASHRSTVVCVDPEVNGRLAAELMAKFLAPDSEVAVITGMFQTEDHRKKVEGFSAAFPEFCPGGKVVEVVEGHDSEEETFRKVFALLERRKNLKGIYVSTANCLPVCHALGAKGLYGAIKLITT
ncbi:MAG: LacI family DNA-binding transcriptional regulator, partial [Steroidobacteraceae bacterium]